MMRKPWIGLLALSAVLLTASTALHAAGKAAKPEDQKDSYQLGVEALTIKRYEVAITCFQQFVSASVGDPRTDAAIRQIHDATLALGKEYEASGREIDAASLYVSLASDPTTTPESKDTYLKQAAQTLNAALTDAQQKHLFDKAWQIVQAWTRLLPGKTSSLTPEQIDALTADAAAAACQDKFTLLALPDVLDEYYGEHPIPWTELTKRNHNESPQVGYFRALADLGWAGRYLAEYQKLEKDSPLRTDKNFMAQTEKMLVRRADAWCAHGYTAAGLAAINAAKEAVASDYNLDLLKQLEQKLAPRLAKMKPERPDLPITAPVKVKIPWYDPGDGFARAKDVVLDDGADVTVNPGFLLDGGSIEVMSKAHLRLAGTATQPVVFRHVRISSHAGGEFEAGNAVFVDCTFERTGDDSGKNTQSNWAFTSCLLYRSRFTALKIRDYNLRLINAACAECVLPDRELINPDLAAVYTRHADQVSTSLFFRTTLMPSTIWLSNKCNFVRCLTGKAEFKSKTPLKMQLFAPETDPLIAALRSGTTMSDVADVSYGFVRKPFDVALPANLWAFLPAELPDNPQDRK